MPEDSFEARLNGTSPVKIKRDGPGAWRAFTFIFALLFIVSTVGAAYFYNKFYTVEESYNKLTKQTISNSEQKQEEQKNETSGNETETPVSPDAVSVNGMNVDVKGLYGLVGVGNGKHMEFEKIAITDDGKYVVAISQVWANEGAGYAGVWYRGTSGDTSWKELASGHQVSYCSGYSQEYIDFVTTYGYIDDDLDSKYLGCYEDDGTERF